MNYLDKLPIEIIDYIYEFVYLLYKKEHENMYKNVLNELNGQWLWVLWNIDIYIASGNCYNILPDKSKRRSNILKYMKNQQVISFIKPSYVKIAKKIKEQYYNNKLPAVNNNDKPDNIETNQP